jgi:single-strand selective monofunctional uracil DNA glycosylase
MRAMPASRSIETHRIHDIYRKLSAELDRLSFGPPVTHVYNPLDYAWPQTERFIDMAAGHAGQVLLLGMNPGPWGMAQTGVPFGTVSWARDWLGIGGAVSRPRTEHPRRPVLGFDTEREEVSGQRFWGWASRRFDTPDSFFRRFFVANYCPLLFLEESGRNRTPDKLAVAERRALYAACDEALGQIVEVLQPIRIVGIGKFAEDRAKAVAGIDGPPVGRILHPSPASPVANRGWASQAERQLAAMGIALPGA